MGNNSAADVIEEFNEYLSLLIIQAAPSSVVIGCSRLGANAHQREHVKHALECVVTFIYVHTHARSETHVCVKCYLA